MAQQNFALFLNECLPDAMLVKHAPKIAVFSLVECPAIPFGTRYKFVTVRAGKRNTVAIGRANSRHASLNLANIRRRGAKMGISEVHLIN